MSLSNLFKTSECHEIQIVNDKLNYSSNLGKQLVNIRSQLCNMRELV